MIRKYPDNIQNTPFFFIIGRPRSGTTLIQTLFEAHPNVVIPPEAPILKQSYYRFNKVVEWKKEQLKQLVDFLFHDAKFKTWNISKAELLDSLLNYPDTLTIETIIKIIYCHYISVFPKDGVHIFGDKNPVYSQNPEKVLEIIPNAKIVHVVRDYRDHILSMQRVKLFNSNLALISDIWRRSQKRIFALMEKYPDSIISFKYEDFVKEPEQHLKMICRFLNIDYVPSVFNYKNKEEELKKANALKISDVFHGNLFKPITADNVDKWKQQMTKRDIAKADFYVGKYAELSGYKRQNPRRTVAGFLIAFPGYLIAYSFHFINDLISIIPIKWRKTIRRKIFRRYLNQSPR